MSGKTRGHSLKLIKYQCNKCVRKFFFYHCVVSKRNTLDNDTVTAKTVNGFKSILERERAKMGLLWTDVCSTLSHHGDSGAAILQPSILQVFP